MTNFSAHTRSVPQHLSFKGITRFQAQKPISGVERTERVTQRRRERGLEHQADL
jgi:hypothetical protein